MWIIMILISEWLLQEIRTSCSSKLILLIKITAHIVSLVILSIWGRICVANFDGFILIWELQIV